MPWTCPLCKRPFKYNSQAHSCVQVSPDSILDSKSEITRKIYKKLITAIQQFGPFDISAARKDIYLKHPGTFLAIKPKKDELDVEFYLSALTDEFPVYKTLRTSKNRVVHYVRLDDPKQIDKQLIHWLQLSYKPVSNS